MRRFTDLEKKYIQKLCNDAKPGDFYIAANLFYDLFLGRGVAYILNSKHLTFYRKEDKVTPNEIQYIIDEVVEIAFLLDYLENNGLIYYIGDNNNSLPDICVLGKNILEENKLLEIHVEIDPKTESVLKKTMTSRVIAGRTLVAFVEDGFKTIEEQQLDETRIQSKTAIESLNEAQTQSEKAIESLEEAQEQTKASQKALCYAKVQTFASWLAVIIALITMFLSRCTTQNVLVEDVKPSVIQTVKKEVLPKQETEEKALPTVQPEKQNTDKPMLGNKTKKNK